MQLSLQSGCISEADETKKRSSPMAEGETRPRCAEGLRSPTTTTTTTNKKTSAPIFWTHCPVLNSAATYHRPKFLQIRWVSEGRRPHPPGKTAACTPPCQNTFLVLFWSLPEHCQPLYTGKISIRADRRWQMKCCTVKKKQTQRAVMSVPH